MFPDREWRRIANKEDVTHFLEELCDFDPDETFCKTLSRETVKRTQGLLDLIEEYLKKITW